MFDVGSIAPLTRVIQAIVLVLASSLAVMYLVIFAPINFWCLVVFSLTSSQCLVLVRNSSQCLVFARDSSRCLILACNSSRCLVVFTLLSSQCLAVFAYTSSLWFCCSVVFCLHICVILSTEVYGFIGVGIQKSERSLPNLR